MKNQGSITVAVTQVIVNRSNTHLSENFIILALMRPTISYGLYYTFPLTILEVDVFGKTLVDQHTAPKVNNNVMSRLQTVLTLPLTWKFQVFYIPVYIALVPVCDILSNFLIDSYVKRYFKKCRLDLIVTSNKISQVK